VASATPWPKLEKKKSLAIGAGLGGSATPYGLPATFFYFYFYLFIYYLLFFFLLREQVAHLWP
jgi:hypothetical protein